jgi:hypothetical protein
MMPSIRRAEASAFARLPNAPNWMVYLSAEGAAELADPPAPPR